MVRGGHSVILGLKSSLTLSLLLVATLDSRAQTPQGYDPLDQFNANGFDQNRDYFSSLPNEHIDPMTGNLILTFTDLVLPGNAGLDVRIQRVYNSKIYRDFHTSGGTLGEDSWAGVGWTMHLGRVLDPNGVPVIEMSDGSRHPTHFLIDNSGRFITKEYWVYDKNTFPPTLKLPNGVVYTFGAALTSDRYVTKIHDPFGNRIEITYGDPGEGEPADGIKTIRQYLSSTDTRVVTFTYETGLARKNLESITFVGEKIYTWTYEHTTPSGAGPIYSLLTEVKPPTGPSWIYSYWTTNPKHELRRVTAPGGGWTEYSYSTVPFYIPGSTAVVNSRAMTQKQTGGHDIPASTSSFSYAEGSNRNRSTFNTPCGQIKYEFLGIGKQVTDAWEVGLLESKEIRGGGLLLQREELTWERGAPISNQPYTTGMRQDSKVWVPLLGRREVTREGETFTTENDYSTANFNDFGRPFRIVETGDRTRTTTFTFDYAFNSSVYIRDKVKSETLAGLAKSYQYDDATGFKTSETIYGVTTTFGRDSFGNVSQVKDALNRTTNFTYDWGVLDNTVTSLYTIQRSINKSGTTSSVTRRGLQTSFDYDTRFRITKIDPPLGSDFVYSYDNTNGRWIRLTRGASFTRTDLDGFGRPSATSNGVGVKTDTDYDACGRVSYQSYPFVGTANKGTTFQNDALGRVTLMRHPDSQEVRFDYDGLDVTITNERGFESTQSWEAYGDPDAAFLTGLTDTANQSWSYDYDVVGNLTEVNPPGSAPNRAWAYNTKNQLQQETHPESGTVSYGYFANGNLQSRTDPTFGQTTYSYDNNNRLTFIDWPGAAFTDLAYDDSDNRTLLENERIRTVFAYDSADRLNRRSDTDKLASYTFCADFDYDGRDNLEFVTYPRESSPGCASPAPVRLKTQYSYDAGNRITRIGEVGGSSEVFADNFQYHPSGGVKQYSTGNGYTHVFEYDSDRYWVSRIYDIGGPESVLDLDYGYDDIGNVETILDSRPNMSQTFGYDALDRLEVATGPWGTIDYGYDTQGNRTTRDEGGASTTFNYSGATNRLTSATGARPDSFGYDANGNLKSTNTGVFSFSVQNMMVASTVSGESASYGYDGDNLRTFKASGSATDHFFHGPGDVLLSEFETSCGDVRAPGRDYVYAGSRLIAAVKHRLDPPVPTAPTIATNDTTPTFQWSASSGATEYGLVVENLSNGTTPVNVSGITATTYTPSAPLPAGMNYRWKVRAFGSTSSSCFSGYSNFEVDVAPPAAVSLTGSAPTPGVVLIGWLAPGDDGAVGTASAYDVRYAPGTTLNFETAIQAVGEPPPAPAGAQQSFTISGLASETTYAIALVSRDNAGNFSSLSNIAVVTTLDTTPPGAITNLQALTPTGRAMTLRWNAPTEDGASGGAVASYDVRYSPSPITAGNFSSTAQATGAPPPASPGVVQSMVVTGLLPESTYYFAMKSIDLAGNVSPISNVVSGTTLPAADVSGTKRLPLEPDGRRRTWFHEGDEVEYTIVLSNSGNAAQGDNVGDELTDTLPPELTLVSAVPTSGVASQNGNTVRWNGAILPSASVTIDIEATVNVGTAAQIVSNQGTISYDSDATGTNDQTALTDDPDVAGSNDATIFQVLSGPLRFYTVESCRLIDTRNPAGPLGGPSLTAGSDRIFTLAGACNIPSTARSVAVNVAVTAATGDGHLRLHAAGTPPPATANINYRANKTRSSNAVVFLNELGQLAVFVGGQTSGTVDLILDVSGYFQ